MSLTETIDAPNREPKTAPRAASSAGVPPHAAGTLWFGGWLFTIGFAKLIWWKALIGVIVWPYFLGEILR